MKRIWVRRRNVNGTMSKWHLWNSNVCPNFTIAECGISFPTTMCETVQGDFPDAIWSSKICRACKWIAEVKFPLLKTIPVTLQVILPENIGMVDLQNILLDLFRPAVDNGPLKRVAVTLPQNIFGAVENITKGPLA